jgi:FtsP/CotA-like multicopper oxidase with cupredoxin domain
MHRIDRRQFLTLVSTASLHPPMGSSEHARSRPVVQEFKAALPIPTILSPVRRDATADYYELELRESQVEILPGVRTRIWGYGGGFPGPTIEARRGRATVVTYTNNLRVPTVAHLHGGVTRPDSDGFPTDTLAPGESRSHWYDNSGQAASLWYHDHGWRDSGRNVYMGLAGFYLLKDDAEVHARLPHGDYDIPLMLQDRAFSGDGELDYDHDGHHGATGRVMLVNGAPWPVLEVAARKYRFRILNASNAMPIQLALDTHRPMTQIGTDQGLLPSPAVLSEIGLTMGERVEVVIDFSIYPVGSRVVLENRRGAGPMSRVMRFDVVRAGRDDSIVPNELTEFAPLQRSQATRIRTFVFGGKPTLRVPPGVRWVINGQSFDPQRVDADPRLDDIEVWRFVNRGFLGQTMLHPVHTHLAPFQILRRNECAPLRQEGGWKDTVAVEDGEEVDVILRWTGYTGRYLLHCHNLEHQDHSMMARVDVV